MFGSRSKGGGDNGLVVTGGSLPSGPLRNAGPCAGNGPIVMTSTPVRMMDSTSETYQNLRKRG